MPSSALIVRAQLHAGVGSSHVQRSPRRGGLSRPGCQRAAWQRRSARGDEAAPSTGGTVPPGTGSTGGGSGGGGGDGSGSGAAGGVVLAGKALESLPAEMAEALKAGKLPEEILQRFLDMDRNPFLSWLMKMG